MTIATIVLIVLVVLSTGLLFLIVADMRKRTYGGRGGESMQLMFVLPVRWLCLAGLLGICVARGAIPWPASPGGQYFAVFTAHGVLGFASIAIAAADVEGTEVGILGWIPFLLPAGEVALAISTL